MKTTKSVNVYVFTGNVDNLLNDNNSWVMI